MTTKEKKEAVLQFLYGKKSKHEYADLEELVERSSSITREDVYWILKSLREKGYIQNTLGLLASITIDGAEYIENLRSSSSSFAKYNPNDKIDVQEQEIVKEKLDELLERLMKLELGQQVIYDDLADEISDLKDLVGVLGKKDWKQMLKVKLVDAGLGNIIGEVGKAAIQTFSNQNLLN